MAAAPLATATGLILLTCRTGNFTVSGSLIGGTIGGNYQIGSLVLGVEGDGDWSQPQRHHLQHVVWRRRLHHPRAIGWRQCAAAPARRGIASFFYGTGGAAFANVQAAAGALAVFQLDPGRLDCGRRRRIRLSCQTGPLRSNICTSVLPMRPVPSGIAAPPAASTPRCRSTRTSSAAVSTSNSAGSSRNMIATGVI